MNDEDADFFPAELKPFDVSRDEIDQKDAAQQPTAGQDGNLPGGSLGLPIDKQTAEKLLLGRVEPNFDLRQGAEKHQQQRNGQTGHGQLERSEEIEKFVEHSRNARFGRTS